MKPPKRSLCSAIQSKLKEIERHQNALAAFAKKRAECAKQMASKTNELNRYFSSLEREEKGERDKQAKQAKKIQDDLERRQKSFERGLSRRINIVSQIKETSISNQQETYDVFISHASEDKESFVKGLADALSEAGTIFLVEI